MKPWRFSSASRFLIERWSDGVPDPTTIFLVRSGETNLGCPFFVLPTSHPCSLAALSISRRLILPQSLDSVNEIRHRSVGRAVTGPAVTLPGFHHRFDPVADYDPLGSWRWLGGGPFLCKQVGIGRHLLPSFVVDAELPITVDSPFRTGLAIEGLTGMPDPDLR
jgi:hypothetical protein